MNVIQKAATFLAHQLATNGPRGVLSTFVPGIGHEWGQPNLANSGVGDIYQNITPERMREIVLKTPSAGGAMNAALDFACGVKVKPRNVDPALKAPVRATKLVTSLMRRPNKQTNQRRFRRKLLRDLFVLGYAAVEIERDADGGVANLYNIDAGRLKVDYDPHGTILGYNMFDFRGQPIIGPDGKHTWLPDDVIWYELDPISESNYPTSRVAQLFACAVVEALMLSYIGARFTDSNVPFGVMDLGELTEDEIEAAVAIWNNQLNDHDHPEHRIIFTGSRGGANWIPFGYDLKKLEAPEILSRVRLMILGILGVTVNEMGEADSVNKANGFNLSFTFKKRVIEPLLDEETETTTSRLIHDELGFQDIELYYEDIDSRDELLQAQIDDIYWKMGIVSNNQIRNRRGDPNIPGGDEPVVVLGTNAVPVSMLQAFAKVQLEALNMVNLQTQVGIMQALAAMNQPTVNADGTPGPSPLSQLPGPTASLPLLRGMQPPERFTTPLGSGSSTVKFKLPKPGMKTPKPGASAGVPTAPRGPVEAAQRVGARKDKINGTA